MFNVEFWAQNWGIIWIKECRKYVIMKCYTNNRENSRELTPRLASVSLPLSTQTPSSFFTVFHHFTRLFLYTSTGDSGGKLNGMFPCTFPFDTCAGLFWGWAQRHGKLHCSWREERGAYSGFSPFSPLGMAFFHAFYCVVGKLSVAENL